MQAEDSAWKEILESCFEQFLEFFFPLVHDEIDWSRQPEWLDKEFQALVRDEDDTKRFIDKLGKVFLLDGEEEWLLVHVEVQGDSEADFNRRMRRYNFLIETRYAKEVLSLAVLTDEVKSFRPGRFLRRRAGQIHFFKFPVVKLIDYEGRREELEASMNPFSIVVLAHLEARRAKTDDQRIDSRFILARRLYRGGFGREDIVRLYRFLEWIMMLPRDLEFVLRDRVETELEGKTRMPFLSTIERVAMEKGEAKGEAKSREGLRAGIRLALKLRFGDAGLALLPAVTEIQDTGRLRSFLDALERIEKIEEFRSLLSA